MSITFLLYKSLSFYKTFLTSWASLTHCVKFISKILQYLYYVFIMSVFRQNDLMSNEWNMAPNNYGSNKISKLVPKT